MLPANAQDVYVTGANCGCPPLVAEVTLGRI
jgi:hypothetical protein